MVPIDTTADRAAEATKGTSQFNEIVAASRLGERGIDVIATI